MVDGAEGASGQGPAAPAEGDFLARLRGLREDEDPLDQLPPEASNWQHEAVEAPREQPEPREQPPAEQAAEQGPDQDSDNDSGDAWVPSEQLAARYQSKPPTDAFEEILRWHKAEERRKAEDKAREAGGLFAFEELPKPEPRLVDRTYPVPMHRRKKEQLRLAEKAAQQRIEEKEREQSNRTARQQIQDALEAELKAVPLGDARRRRLRERAKRDMARAPPDQPTPQQAKEWAMLLCVLQKENPAKKEVLPVGTPDGVTPEPLKPVIIEEPEAIEILKRRADVNFRVGDLKRYPLHAAAERCYPNLIAELLKASADANKADFAGEIPLHTIAHSGGWCDAPPGQRRLAVETLVEGRADMNFANPRGRTPLHIACSAGDGTVMKALIDEAADVNAADLGGFTPLMWAAGHGRGEVVQELLDAKADPSLQANRGQTAMLFALTNNKTLVVEALESHLALMDRQAERRRALKKEGEKEGAQGSSTVATSEGKSEDEAKRPKQTLYHPYMGLVQREYAPDLSSNVY